MNMKKLFCLTSEVEDDRVAIEMTNVLSEDEITAGPLIKKVQKMIKKMFIIY